MRIVKKVLFILAIILLSITAISFIFFSSHIHVERSIVIKKDQPTVFGFVNNLGNWNSWSPWHDMDTTAKYTFEGPATGVGSTLKWVSENSNVGKGSMKLIRSEADSVIVEELNFMEQGVAQGTFRFAPEGDGTKITWGFDVEAGANPIMRIMGKFMDGMMGKDFDKGLATLKSILESMPEPQAEPLPVDSASMSQK